MASDGEGKYKVRFMPSFEGDYTFKYTEISLINPTGETLLLPRLETNHGPVR